MNYYEAREIADKEGKPTGKYHYTGKNGKRIWPTGYCAEECDGHDTPEEACEHQRQFELDNADYDRKSTSWRKCEFEGCEEISNRFAQIGHAHIYVLCEDHCNKESVEKFHGTPNQVWSSW